MKTNITLVTGCSTGIGRALAEEFHRRGHVVYATARRVSTLSALEARGIRTATLDVTDGESIRRLQARLQHDGVTVALLINNAGYGALGPLAELPMNELRLQFETNAGLFGADVNRRNIQKMRVQPRCFYCPRSSLLPVWFRLRRLRLRDAHPMHRLGLIVPSSKA
jgi:short-subunit dehydrogenase